MYSTIFLTFCQKSSQSFTLLLRLSLLIKVDVEESLFFLIQEIRYQLPDGLLHHPFSTTLRCALRIQRRTWINHLSEKLSSGNNAIKVTNFSTLALDFKRHFVPHLRFHGQASIVEYGDNSLEILYGNLPYCTDSYLQGLRKQLSLSKGSQIRGTCRKQW